MAKESKSSPPAPTPRGGYSPLADFRLQMDRLFDDFFGGWLAPSRMGGGELLRGGFEFVSPQIEVAETADGVEVTAELPGIEEKDIEVTLHDGVLTIKGEKKVESEKKEKNYLLSERRYGSFQRSLRLPDGIDEGKVKASFEKGVLKIMAARAAGAKASTRRIPIGK